MKLVEKPPPGSQEDNFWEYIDDFKSRIQEILQIDETSYPYWDKWKYYAKNWKVDAEKLWFAVKAFRYGKKKINFKGQNNFEMSINTPSAMQEQLHELDMDLGGSLHAGSLIPEDEKKFYLISSLMEEAIASSQMEGAATTRRVAKEMLESSRKPINSSEQMIVNNYEVMQWIVGHKNAKLTPEIIQEMHLIITKKTLNDATDEGRFRTRDDIDVYDVQTNEVVYTPPGHRYLKQLMNEFCLFANDETKQHFFLHPITKAIAIHFLMGYIHPFADGNGRTARALFYWYLIKKGYWLIEYMSVSRIILASKAQYARAYQYTELDEMDLTYFVMYNLREIRKALEELKKYISKKNEEKRRILTLLRNTDFNERQLLILKDIIDEQKSIFSVQEIENKYGVSNQTARNDLNRLVERGILETRKNGNQIKFLPAKNFAKKLNLPDNSFH
jgi:Fic family protein